MRPAADAAASRLAATHDLRTLAILSALMAFSSLSTSGWVR